MTPPTTSGMRRCSTVHVLSGPIGVQGAQPGDLLVIDILDVGPIPQEDSGPLAGQGWGYTGIFATQNGGGFLTEQFPDAYKVIWDFSGGKATSRHVPRVSFTGIVHPGLMGTAPSKELLARWNKREGDLIATDPNRVPALALPPLPKDAILGSLEGEAFTNAAAEAARTAPPRENGGNQDIKNFTKGTRVFYPVFVDGANLSMGDLHFSQGDGEITFCGAIEMGGFIDLHVDLIKGGMDTYGVSENAIFMPGNSDPQYAEWLAFSGTSVTLDGTQRYLDSHLSYQRACLHAIDYLTKFGYTPEQGYMILGAAPIEGRLSGVVDIPTPAPPSTSPRPSSTSTPAPPPTAPPRSTPAWAYPSPASRSRKQPRLNPAAAHHRREAGHGQPARARLAAGRTLHDAERGRGDAHDDCGREDGRCRPRGRALLTHGLPQGRPGLARLDPAASYGLRRRPGRHRPRDRGPCPGPAAARPATRGGGRLRPARGAGPVAGDRGRAGGPVRPRRGRLRVLHRPALPAPGLHRGRARRAHPAAGRGAANRPWVPPAAGRRLPHQPRAGGVRARRRRPPPPRLPLRPVPGGPPRGRHPQGRPGRRGAGPRAGLGGQRQRGAGVRAGPEAPTARGHRPVLRRRGEPRGRRAPYGARGDAGPGRGRRVRPPGPPRRRCPQRGADHQGRPPAAGHR